MAHCDCQGWKTNDTLLTAIFQAAQNHGMVYKGTPFTHCPWCGKKLVGKEA